MIRFTSDAEKERVEKAKARRAKWEFFSTTSIVEATRFAKEQGWEENKVQVKSSQLDDGLFEYSVEPYEIDCHCPNLLRYDDYFIRKDEDIVLD